jgi:hypothetical protein
MKNGEKEGRNKGEKNKERRLKKYKQNKGGYKYIGNDITCTYSKTFWLYNITCLLTM